MHREYMLIAHPAAGSAGGSFATRFTEALAAARGACQDIDWHAQFVIGPKDCVEIFSAPTPEAADNLSRLVAGFAGLRTEVVPLRSRW